MKSFTQKMRMTTLCVLTAAAIALPTISYAGPVDTIKNKVEDVQKKVNSVYSQVKNSSPLIKVMKDGKLINDLKDIMMYLNQSRADYQQFANSGVHVFAQDMQSLITGFGDVGATMKMEGLSDRLAKSQDLIDKLPPQFMYIIHKAIGSTVIKLREDLDSLNEKLEVVADLPSNREMMTNPELYTDKLCPLVTNQNTKITYTVIMARLKLLSVKLDYVNDMIPDDLTIVINVVGGGGTNIPFPAKPISQTFKLIKDSMIQRLENANDIAGAICE